MGSKTPATQTVTNKTEVDPTTDAWRQTIFGAGNQLYNQGPAEYYPGQTVAPFSQQTQSGLNMMQGQAMQGAVGLPQAYNAANRAMSGMVPGMNTAMQASNGGMNNQFYGAMGAAAGQQAAPQVTGMINQSMNTLGANQYGPQIAQTGEQQTQMGVGALQDFTGGMNPHLQGMYDQGANQITNDLNARFAKAGRTGANAAYGQALGSSLGQLYTGIMAPAYEAAQDRKMSAAGQLAGIDQGNRAAQMQGYTTAAGLGQQSAGLGLQAAGMYGDVLGQDYSRQMQGASQMAGMYGQDMDRRLSGAGLAGDMWSQGNADASQASNDLQGLYQYGQMPGQAMLGVGSAYDAYNQQLIDADMARYNYGQNAQWDNLSRFAGMMNGLPDFSSTTQTTQGAGQNRLMGAMGGAASGASMGSMFGPMGMGIGAGLGGLMSLFG